MKMWQLYSLMATAFIAPNLPPSFRGWAAVVCLIASTAFGYFKL